MGRYSVILVGSLVAGLAVAGCSSDSGSAGRQTSDSAPGVLLDGLRPSTADGGEGCTAGCSEGNVCCTAPLPCAGKCLPDCRVSGSCPEQAPTCDQATGLCTGSKSDDPSAKPPLGDGGPKPPLGDGGSKPPLGDGGLKPPQGDCSKDGCPMKDAVCCESPLPCAGMCVPDCRLSSGTCPQQAPTCDQTTGVCK